MAWYPNAERHPSPNFGYPTGAHGRNGMSIGFYVEHITASDSGKIAHRNWFLKPNNVAPHFCVFTDGTIDQYADTEDASWHTNPVVSPDPRLNLLTTNANLVTIGIEWQGIPGEPLTEPQILAGIELHRWLDKTHPLFRIDREHVIGHNQINSVDRANDPGPAFPWDRLLAALKEDDMTDVQRLELQRVANIFASWQAALEARAQQAAALGYGITDSYSARLADELNGAVESLRQLAQ